MRETIYRTPRTYGSPVGYDSELSHYPDMVARLAENLLLRMAMKGERVNPSAQVCNAFEVAEEFYRQAQERGHVLEIQDAPGMKQDYGTTRGKP